MYSQDLPVESRDSIIPNSSPWPVTPLRFFIIIIIIIIIYFLFFLLLFYFYQPPFPISVSAPYLHY